MTRTPAEQTEYIAFLKKENFLKNLRQSDDATIARFLGIDLADLTKSTINTQINAEYDSMSEHEIDQFDAEMQADRKGEDNQRHTRPQLAHYLTLDQFVEQLQIAGLDRLMRFLDVDLDTLSLMRSSNEVTQRIADVHSQMTSAEIGAWEREILGTIRMNRKKQPVWSRICHDHHEETDGFIVGYVDAWYTTNEDEEGQVIEIGRAHV